MKLMHLSDLHLGKRVNEVSMLDEQRDILAQIVAIVDCEQPDAVLIAGDIYDKPVPPAEAVQIFDEFLYQLAKRELQVFIISGNHDSAERIAFCSRLMDRSGIHFSPVYSGTVEPVLLHDAYGTLGIYMLPFIKPVHVRQFYPDETVTSYTDALKVAIAHMELDQARRNILVTHQFVTGATRSESEEISIGGADNVDAAVFAPFDYVALGHIHGQQNIGTNTVRYCGTPLKYSFSEAGHVKSVTCVELLEKGKVTVRAIPLRPRHDLREVRGTFQTLMDKAKGTEDYLHVILTDEEDVPNAFGKLRAVYPNLLKVDYDNTRTRSAARLHTAEDFQKISPLTLFAEFYETQNGRPMSARQKAFSAALMEEIWGEML